ncbi:MAG: ATP-binding protein [Phycisphaerales bacterium]
MKPSEFHILLSELLAHGRETPWLEFKGNNADEAKVGEYVSAIANAAALHDQSEGFLVWGIDDATLSPIGTSFQPEAARIGNQPLLIHLAANLEPAVMTSVLEGDRAGKRVVVLRVPPAAMAPIAYKGVRYIRIGESKTTLQGRAEERTLFAKLERTPFEDRPARCRLDEPTLVELLDYPAYFSLSKVPLPSNRAGILERLAADRLVRKEPDGWVITNLGALLFAKALSSFEALARKAVRVVVYRSDNRADILKQHSGVYGYAAGFKGLVAWINDQLPQNVHIGEALRTEASMYPGVAIREIVANALIHQDLSITGAGPLIEIFPTRVEVANPGRPLIEPQRFLDLPPRSRNEGVAAMMRRLGMCEELGSGIDRVLTAVEFFQLPPPEFAVAELSTRATLFAHRSFGQMSREERVRAAYQHAGLMYITGKRMTNGTLRERLGVKAENYPQVSSVIREALDGGMILPDDPENRAPRHAKYIPYWAAGVASKSP